MPFSTPFCHMVLYFGSNHSQKIFKLQKRAITITTGSRNKDSRKTLLKQLKVVMFKSQYKFLPYSFVSGEEQGSFYNIL